MAIKHVHTNTNANGTNSDVVRHNDWSSGHNEYITVAGNTTGTSTVSGTNIYWAGGNNATLSINGSTVSMHGPSTSSFSIYEPYRPVGLDTLTVGINTRTSGIASFFPFILEQSGQFGMLNIALSMNYVTGTTRASWSNSHVWGLYSQGTGTNSTTISTITSGSFAWSVSHSNTRETIRQITVTSYSGYGATASTNSSGVNLSSAYTGLKMVGLPLGAAGLAMTPGYYWFGWHARASSNGNSFGIYASLVGQDIFPASVMAPIGSFSSDYSSGTNRLNQFGGPWLYGAGSYTAAGLTTVPASVELSAISYNSDFSFYPRISFWST